MRDLTRRQALAAGGALALWAAGCGGRSGTGEARQAGRTDAAIEDGPLLLANWIDYSDPANYRAFTERFGPKVTLSRYGSNDELLAKLRAGGARFDVVAPTGFAVKTMIEQGLALKLDKALIPNLENLQPAFTKTEYDPGNQYSAAKDYGITSFWWREDKTDFDGTTLKEAFEFLKTPEARRLRVNFLEGATQVVGIALKGLGHSLNTEDEDELAEAGELLKAVKPNVDTINSNYIERATNGEIDMAMVWNGDIRRASVPLRERGIESTMMVPEDSTEYWIDNWVIPKGAQNPVAAHKFIDFMLDPVAAGREMNYHTYPVPVKGIQGVDPELAEDPMVAIPQERLATYETQLQTPRGQALRDRVYTEFKAA